jgi:hypothetical protein
MAICSCGSPAFCCYPAVAGGVIYADLRGELSTHLFLQALFTQSSPVCKPMLQAFPFPSTLGEVTLHPLSQACVFVFSSLVRWVFPLSCGVFLPPLLSEAFLHLVAGRTPQLLPESLSPSLACLFTVLGRIPFPPSLVLSVPHPLSHMSLLFLLLITQFLFFPQVEVGLSRRIC